MLLNRKFLFLFFGFFSFYAQTEQDIDKENKEFSVFVEDVGILKKITALSNKEKFFLIYEILGGKILKYHFFILSFLYLWDVLTKKILKHKIKYAPYIVNSWGIFSLFCFPDALLALNIRSYVLGLYNRHNKLKKLQDFDRQYPALKLVPFSMIVAWLVRDKTLNICQKLNINTHYLSLIPFLINVILINQEKLFIFPKVFDPEKMFDSKHHYGEEVLARFEESFNVAEILNNALDERIENDINDCENYFLLLGQNQKLKLIKNLIDHCSFDIISTLIKNDEIKEFFLRYYNEILKNPEVPDDLKLEFLTPIKNGWRVIKNVLENLCYLKDRDKRQELVNRYLNHLGNQNNEINHSLSFRLNFIDEAENKIINFYDDVYIIARPLLQQLIEQQKSRSLLYHDLFNSLHYSDQSHDLLFKIYKDLFHSMSEIIDDKAKLFVENTDGFKPLEILLKKFSPLRQELFEYISEKENINVKVFFRDMLFKIFKLPFFLSCGRFCIDKENFPLIDYIISKGVDLNALDENGNLIVYYYIKNFICELNNPLKVNSKIDAYINVIQILINGGCDLNVCNKDGLTLLDLFENDSINKYPELVDFLKEKGGIKSGNSILFNIKNFLAFEVQNKNIFIEKFIGHLLKQHGKINPKSVLGVLYPNFINDPYARKNNESLISYSMKYHLENNIEKSDEKIFNELSVLQSCMIELSENSEKYKIGTIFGGNLPALYGDWLLEIVEKRLALNSGDCTKNEGYNGEESVTEKENLYGKKIEHIDVVFNWFLQQQYPCDFTRYCGLGQNVFHKISHGGLLYYFESIFDTYKGRSTKNMHDALLQKSMHDGMQKESPFEVAKKQAHHKYSNEQDKKLYEKMETSLKYLENNI